ncbi:MAG: hypothetical protein PF447_09375 [Spirochaetaceae bacterium]|nr:hypothetical protein [Spirochaetaceae bacterium]
MKKILLILMILFCAAAIFAEGTMEIGEITAQPRKYVGKSLLIGGEVTKISAIPFTDYQIQTVYDRTGTLAVLSPNARTIGETLSIEVGIVGFNTENIEDSTRRLADELSELLKMEGILSPQDAENLARGMALVLSRVLQAMDASLLGIEEEVKQDEPPGTSI